MSLPPASSPAKLKQQRELRACLRHLLGFSQFEEMTSEICDVAEFVVSTVTGAPTSGSPLAVLAAGKLGTREATIDADLDLLFVTDSRGSRGLAAAEKRAARIVADLTAVGPEGKLYEIDLRLRPEGRNAPLVVDAARYEDYLRNRASLWERQMLTRVRFLCGSRPLGERVVRMISGYTFSAALPDNWVPAIVEMRRKMETRSRTRGGEILDVKLGPGGMADIEFLVQMWMLSRHSPPASGATVAALLAAATPDLLTVEESDEAARAYAVYRRLELLLRVTLEERSSILPAGSRLDLLARRYGAANGDALITLVKTTMRRIRAMFLTVTTRLSTGERA